MVKGMKQTEIGMIPEDWSPRIVGDVLQFSGGSQPPLYTFSSVKKKGYVRLIQIRDYKTDKYKVHIPENLGRKFCNKEDIMIGRYGPPIFQILRGIEGVYNVALLKAIPNENVIKKDFAWHFLRSETLFNFVDKLSQRSSGQTGVDLVELRNFPIPLPPLPEQEAIAGALSDADAWIESLEQLIAKKRLVKQGAMQELLTPGEDWEVKKLGEIINFKNGAAHENVVDENGDYIIVNSKFISQDGRVRKYSNAYFCPLYVDEIVMVMSDIPNGKALAKCFIIDKDETYTLNQRICAFEAKENFYPKFLFYIINRNDYFLSFDSGSGQTNLRRDEILNCPISFPSLTEQTRIATILSDMDAELEALEQQLHKARQIKQGMMQELLTGEIRFEL